MITLTHTEWRKRLHLEVAHLLAGSIEVKPELERSIALVEKHLERTGKEADGIEEWVKLKDQLVIAYQARSAV